ncbi:ADP-ribosylation factor-like protein 2-binding protein [Lineus longissimus]|uniref:ADP-ribosylation factor-like protein 2-binding protein n=1 Tax=Lineus longissimus TaxID=88925 RepID=UPI002B4E2029
MASNVPLAPISSDGEPQKSAFYASGLVGSVGVAVGRSSDTMEVEECRGSCGMEEVEEEGEILAASSAKTDSDESKFNITIGHIEDIVMDDRFQGMQENFYEKYYQEFDDDEENKLIYTTIHNEYTELIETYLLEQLSLQMPDFDMEEFANQLSEKQESGGEEMEGEIFEMLLTFTDFLAFKEIMLAYKASKLGTAIDLSEGLQVTSLGSGEPSIAPHVHTIDLNFSSK